MIDERRLKDWEDTLMTRVGRCGLEHSTPKRVWFTALDAIDAYRALQNETTEASLKAALKDADIYVPREL